MNDAPWRFSVGPFAAFEKEYIAEIKTIATTSQHSDFLATLRLLSDYDKYLTTRSKLCTSVSNILEAHGQSEAISITSNKPELIRQALLIANIASACHLLHGTSVPLMDFNTNNLLGYARHFIESCKNRPPEYIKKIVAKFHTIDTIRVIHFLRGIGLFLHTPDSIRQIGFGSADGTRDIVSAHLTPHITLSGSGSADSHVHLQCNQNSTIETIIVDAEPLYKEHYDALNSETGKNIFAYNMDTIEFLQNGLHQHTPGFNLITAIRIDHRMLPDVHLFLSALAPWISDRCDLIMTIGAGDSIADFRGRILKFREIRSILSELGLSPIIFTMYKTKGSLTHQQQSLLFGNMRASSYEILYCSLRRDALKSIANQ